MSNATIVQTLKGFASGQEMRDAMGLTIGSGMDGSTKHDAIRYLWNGKHYILFVRILYRVSYQQIDDLGFVRGKIIILNGKMYKVRLMSGSEEYNSTNDSKVLTPNTEYYQFVKMRKSEIYSLTGGQLLTSSNYSLVMQNQRLSGNSCLYCKFSYDEVSDNRTTYGNYGITANTSGDYHFVFILEELSPTISIETTDLGDIIGDDNSIDYTVTHPNNLPIDVTIKIDDNIVSSITNVSSGTRLEYVITNEDLKNLSYGKHKITFTPSFDSDGTTIIGEEQTVSFTKVKKLNSPLTNANLGKLVNQIKLVSEDMDYQLLRLNQVLSNMGITVNDTSSLANIVKYLRDNGGQIKRWASGTASSYYESDDHKINVKGLIFKPTIIFYKFRDSANNEINGFHSNFFDPKYVYAIHANYIDYESNFVILDGEFTIPLFWKQASSATKYDVKWIAYE